MVEQDDHDKIRRTLLSMLTLGPRTCAEERTFALWCLAWAVSLFVTKWVTRNELVGDPLVWIFPIIALLLSVMTFFKYYQFLMRADELARKIQIEGISFGFGIGLLLMMAQEALDTFGIPELESDDLLLVMVLGWMAGQIWGHWKYA